MSIMILNNIFIETLRRKEIGKSDTVGDGTGYSLTVTKHYRSMREKHGESVKKGQFVYSFALMDLGTGMYIGYAVSLKLEKDAYMKALDMIASLRIDLESVRLDRYYSGQSILDDFSENTRIFIVLTVTMSCSVAFFMKSCISSVDAFMNFVKSSCVSIRAFRSSL